MNYRNDDSVTTQNNNNCDNFVLSIVLKLNKINFEIHQFFKIILLMVGFILIC